MYSQPIRAKTLNHFHLGVPFHVVLVGSEGSNQIGKEMEVCVQCVRVDRAKELQYASIARH